MRIGVASAAAVPTQFDDDALLLSALLARGADATRVVWTDPDVRWDRFDTVVIRSTWDYPRHHAAFLRWVAALEPRVQNPSRVVRWNSDKHHLADLDAAGIPVVPTRFVEPGAQIPPLSGEVVIKPAISAGGRDTGRFDPTTHGQATALISRLLRQGRSVLIQPYLTSVDRSGEVALVFIGGRYSHAAHKRAVLRPNEEAPLRDDELGGAEVMYDPTLVVPGAATEPQVDLAAEAVAYVRERFDVAPAYARVDLVSDEQGDPVVLELEVVEPNLFLRYSEDAADRLAAELMVR